MKKNFKKLIGITAFIALIVFTLGACDLNLGYSASDFAGSRWEDSLIGWCKLRFINNTDWELSYGGECGGTYEVSGSKIYFTYEWGNRNLTMRPETLEIVDKNTIEYPGGMRLKRQ
jgi:hypothetical protein